MPAEMKHYLEVVVPPLSPEGGPQAAPSTSQPLPACAPSTAKACGSSDSALAPGSLAGAAVVQRRPALLVDHVLRVRLDAQKVATRCFSTETAHRRLLAEVCAEVHCRRPPQVIVSAHLRCPLVAGLFKPRIYLPVQRGRAFSDRSLRFIFLHELGHLSRGDLWINFVAALLRALHWFNPFVWFATRRLRAAAELSGDAWVLHRLHPEDARPYGQTLLDLLETQSIARAWPGTVAMAESKEICGAAIESISLGRPCISAPRVAFPPPRFA